MLFRSVNDDQSADIALGLGQNCDKIWKAIEVSRKDFVRAPNDFVGAVNGLAKYYQELLKNGVQKSKDKLNIFAKAKALEAQKAAEAERRARAEMQAKLDAEAAQMTAEAKAQDETAEAITAPKLPDAPPPVESKTIRAASGSATMVKTWKYEVIDPDIVPREFTMIDEKAIRAAVKDGIREIPGVRIFEDTNVRFGK